MLNVPSPPSYQRRPSYTAAVVSKRYRIIFIIGLVLVGLLGVGVFNGPPDRASVEQIVKHVSSYTSYSQPRPRKPIVHFLIPATAANTAFCRTLQSALLHDFTPRLVNFGMTKDRNDFNRAAKLQGVWEYLRYNTSAGREPSSPTKNRELVVMIDGYDVLTQQTPSILVDRFFAQPARILWGADKACWPNDMKQPVCTDVPNSTLPSDVYGPLTDKKMVYTRPRWLNSGTVIGYSEDMLALYSEIVNATRGRNFMSDQGVIARYYAKNTYDMALDFRSELFQTMAGSLNDVVFLPDNYANQYHDKSVESARSANALGRPVIWNRISGTLPVMVHFNGFSEKPFFEAWWNQTWLGHSDFVVRVNDILADKGAYFGHNGSWIGWTELCGQIWEDEVRATVESEYLEEE